MKNKKIGFIIFVLIFLASFTSSHAIFGSATSTDSGKIYPRATIIKGREIFKGELRESKGELKEVRASISAEIKAKREEYKIKIKTIRDTKKQEKVEKINTRLPEINKKRTEEMMAILTKMSSIIDRIANSQFPARIATQSVAGGQAQSSKLNELILAAKTAIDDARSAVLAQSEKDYVVTITTENALKTTVGQTVSAMEQDLRATREKVIAAKKAVVDAFAELMRLKGGSEATGSGGLK